MFFVLVRRFWVDRAGFGRHSTFILELNKATSTFLCLPLLVACSLFFFFLFYIFSNIINNYLNDIQILFQIQNKKSFYLEKIKSQIKHKNQKFMTACLCCHCLEESHVMFLISLFYFDIKVFQIIKSWMAYLKQVKAGWWHWNNYLKGTNFCGSFRCVRVLNLHILQS